MIYYYMTRVKIGCSGFFHDHWKGTFYPDDLSRRQWLEYYCKRFPTVELNVAFHRVPEKETFSRWFSETPEGFTVSLKGSRFITHVKKLKSPVEPLDVFFSRVNALRDKLGVVLWQFPPDFKADTGKLVEFIETLNGYKVRNAFEFRDKSWICKKTVSILEKNKMAFCCTDWPETFCDLPITADFVYIRRHGPTVNEEQCSSYNKDQLKTDAKMISKLRKQVKDIFIYFNNDVSGYAPKNANELKNLLKK